MDRTEASKAPARGGDRTDGRPRGPVPVGRILAAVTVAVVALLPWGPRAADGAAKTPAPTLTLLAPTSLAGPTSAFALRLGLPPGASASGAVLRVTVYGYLRDLTEFNETLVGSTVHGAIASSGPIAVTSLPVDPDHPGGVDLTVGVTAAGVAGPGAGTAPFTVALPCAVGSCGGVYPVRLELSDPATGADSRLLTYLVYTGSSDIEPLRFALVVPLGLPTATSAAVGAAPSVTGASVAALSAVMTALSGPRASVPVTLEPDPATVAALETGHGTRVRAAVAALGALTAGAGRQTVCGPFVPVDASALVAAAGANELATQVHRGTQVLDAFTGLHPGGCTGGSWVTDDPVGPTALAALAAVGDDEVVVPPTAVTGPGPSTTAVRRFVLDGAPAGSTAMLSDPGLSTLLQSTSPDPALAADQVLAELALEYDEAPNTPDGRGVVVAPPAGWQANATVLSDVLGGLEDNPMVQPVTLATLFSEVPVGGTVLGADQPATRRPVAGSTSTLPGGALRPARARWRGLAAALAGSSAGTTVVTTLGDFLLAAESRQLTPAQRRGALAHFEAAVDQQLALLSITSRQVRLTARGGSVPITVLKNAAYPVRAVLTVTSDKIAFSTGGSEVPNTECRTPVVTTVGDRSSVSTQCSFVHGTNIVYIEMQSRVSGDFRMSVTLTSPGGGLQLAGGQLTVRSSSTSAVAIGLSVAAGAVLLGWWGRTLWRGRRGRRGAHRRGATVAA